MNLIRAALFAVFAFMGTISLSAQSWLPPAAAAVVISNELTLLNAPDAPVPTQSGLSGLKDRRTSDVNCSECLLKNVKKQFLTMTLTKLKNGATDTGVAVEEVRVFLIGGANGNNTLLTAIQQGYQYMDTIL